MMVWRKSGLVASVRLNTALLPCHSSFTESHFSITDTLLSADGVPSTIVDWISSVARNFVRSRIPAATRAMTSPGAPSALGRSVKMIRFTIVAPVLTITS